MIIKIFVGLGSIILLLIIFAVIMGTIISSRNNQRAKKEEILKGKGSLKRAFIVYQSGATGLTKKMAYKIAKGLNDGGYEVTIDYPGSYLDTNIDKYSILIFGSPVYGGKPLSIVTDYMKKLNGCSSKKVVVFSTGAGKNIFTELDEMEKALNKKAYKKVKFLKSDKKKAYDLGKELSRL